MPRVTPAHDAIASTPDLISAWDFAEPAGHRRTPFAGRQREPLAEVNGLVDRAGDAPLGGGAAGFANGAYLAIGSEALGRSTARARARTR